MRAHETARIVAEPRGLEVTAIRDLRERNFGTWEGLTDEEIYARSPAGAGPLLAGVGRRRDARRDGRARARRAAPDRRDAPGERVLVVSHGGPLRAVLRHCGIDGVGRIDNCHVVRVEVVDGDSAE